MKSFGTGWFNDSPTRYRVVHHGRMSLAIEFALSAIGWPLNGYGGRGFIQAILAMCNGRESGILIMSHVELGALLVRSLSEKAKCETVRRHINGYYLTAKQLNRLPIQIERGITFGAATTYDVRPLLKLAATALSKSDAMRARTETQNQHSRDATFNPTEAIRSLIPQLLIFIPVFDNAHSQITCRRARQRDAATLAPTEQVLPTHQPRKPCFLLGPQIRGGTRTFPSKIESDEFANWAAEKLAFLLSLAREGYAILPLHYPVATGVCSCPLQGDCKHVGKHPAIPPGVHGASNDAKQITAWFTRQPLFNPGITCEKLLVVDVDFRNGGHYRLRKLEHSFERLPPTRIVKTGGGRHYYFRRPDLSLRKVVGFRDGIDILIGPGNYIVAPYGRHRNGTEYRIESRAESATAEAPEWLVGLILSESTDSVIDNSSLITHGRRNNWLFAQGFKLPYTEEADIRVALQTLFEERCQKVAKDPLDEREIARIAASVAKYKNGRRLSRLSAGVA